MVLCRPLHLSRPLALPVFEISLNIPRQTYKAFVKLKHISQVTKDKSEFLLSPMLYQRLQEPELIPVFDNVPTVV